MLLNCPKVTIQSVAVVSIHKIDVDEIATKMKNGEFKGRPSFAIPAISSQEITMGVSAKSTKINSGTKSILNATSNKSSSDQSDRCIYVDPTGGRLETVTSNIRPFKNIDGGECLYCRREFKHKGLGYAIDVDYSKGDPCYTVEDAEIDRPECVIAYLLYIQLDHQKRDKYLRLTQKMLMSMFGTTIPYRPATDFRLLEPRGPLTYEEWTNYNVTYEMKKNVQIMPIKREYRINKKK